MVKAVFSLLLSVAFAHGANYDAYKGFTSYNGHGGIELDSESTAHVGLVASACQGRCDGDDACDCVSFRHSDGKCWKRSACVPSQFGVDPSYDTFVKSSGYVLYAGMTSYNGHGGTEIDSDSTAPTGLLVEACEARCSDDTSCDCASFRPANGKCWKRASCDPYAFGSDDDFETFVKKGSPSPSPPAPAPTPTPSPAPPGFSDVTLEWRAFDDGHGACNGPAIQGDDVAQNLDNNGIALTTNASPAGGCVFRVAAPSIDLDAYPHLEADIETSGNREAYGQHSGQWFSFWMYPPPYAYAHGDGESGEVDFVENINSVRTNFAGCRHDCHETEWGQASNAVRAHVTMRYDKSAQRINVYRCNFGSETCPTNGEVAYVDLPKMTVNKPYTYTLCTDVWYAQPGMDFLFSAQNVRILSAESFGKYVNSSFASIV